MGKQEQRVDSTFEGVNAATRQAFDAMTTGFSGWLRNMTRLQAETSRFVSERFAKDVEMITQLAQCKRPEDVLALQGKLMSGLLADYSEESARFFALVNDVIREGAQELAKSVGGQARG